jgi:hypothetical protein
MSVGTYLAGGVGGAVLAVLLIRSFVVTLVVEGLVLAPLLRRERDSTSVVGAVAYANVLSYVATAAVLTVLAH